MGDGARSLFSTVAAEAEKAHPHLDQICQAVVDGINDLRHDKSEAPVDFKKLDASLDVLRTCLGEDVPAFRLLHDRARKALLGALGPPKQRLLATCLGEAPWSLRYAVDHLNSLLDRVWTFLGEHLRVYRPMYNDLLSD